MDLVVYDDDEQRYVPWAVALAALLLVALLTAGLTFLLARQAAGSTEEQSLGGGSTPEAATAPLSAAPLASASAGPASGATQSPACVAALERADAALKRSAGVDEALVLHTQIMDELLAERLTPEQALDRTLPVLTDGATERRLFAEALEVYQAAREQCRS